MININKQNIWKNMKRNDNTSILFEKVIII